MLLTPSYPVPAITPAVLASNGAVAHGFVVHQRHLRRDGTTPGQILGQQPTPGTKLAEGGAITVTVSDGPALGGVPDLTNVDQPTAMTRLRAAGYVPVAGATPYSDTFKAGTVLDWEPRGTQPHGTQVVLTISNGRRPVTVPNLGGDTYDQAKSALEALGLPSTQAQVFDDTTAIGLVVSTTPGPGDVAPGTSVTINVSQGPKIVVVPDVSGETITQAIADLTAKGLQAGAQYGPPRAKHVYLTDPAAGSSLPHGSTVNLYTGR